ncbi:hypothetical protein [Algivirga pacifica]
MIKYLKTFFKFKKPKDVFIIILLLLTISLITYEEYDFNKHERIAIGTVVSDKYKIAITDRSLTTKRTMINIQYEYNSQKVLASVTLFEKANLPIKKGDKFPLYYHGKSHDVGDFNENGVKVEFDYPIDPKDTLSDSLLLEKYYYSKYDKAKKPWYEFFKHSR